MKDSIRFILFVLILGMFLMIISWIAYPKTLQLNNVAAILGMLFLTKHIWD
jgi:hypothetical protein